MFLLHHVFSLMRRIIKFYFDRYMIMFAISGVLMFVKFE
jgi:hypothetical protein